MPSVFDFATTATAAATRLAVVAGLSVALSLAGGIAAAWAGGATTHTVTLRNDLEHQVDAKAYDENDNAMLIAASEARVPARSSAQLKCNGGTRCKVFVDYNYQNIPNAELWIEKLVQSCLRVFWNPPTSTTPGNVGWAFC